MYFHEFVALNHMILNGVVVRYLTFTITLATENPE